LMVARVEHQPPSLARPRGFGLPLLRMVKTGLTTLETIGRSRLETARVAEGVRPRRRARLLSQAAPRLVDAHGIEGGVSRSCDSGPAILVANHLGYLDPLIIASLLPCVPISKSEFAHWPLLGSAARSLGVLFVRRGDAHSGARTLREAARLLE